VIFKRKITILVRFRFTLSWVSGDYPVFVLVSVAAVKQCSSRCVQTLHSSVIVFGFRVRVGRWCSLRIEREVHRVTSPAYKATNTHTHTMARQWMGEWV